MIWAVRSRWREKTGGQGTSGLTDAGHFLLGLEACPTRKGSVNQTLPMNQWLMFSQALS